MRRPTPDILRKPLRRLLRQMPASATHRPATHIPFRPTRRNTTRMGHRREQSLCRLHRHQLRHRQGLQNGIRRNRNKHRLGTLRKRKRTESTRTQS